MIFESINCGVWHDLASQIQYLLNTEWQTRVIITSVLDWLLIIIYENYNNKHFSVILIVVFYLLGWGVLMALNIWLDDTEVMLQMNVYNWKVLLSVFGYI